MVNILRIKAYGVIGKYNYNIDFSSFSGNIKALYAENGHGKTNLLKAIRYISIADIESIGRLLRTPVSHIEIESINGTVKYKQNKLDKAFFEIQGINSNKKEKFEVSFSDIKQIFEDDSDFIYLEKDIQNKYQKLNKSICEVIGKIELLGTDRLYILDEYQFKSKKIYTSRKIRRIGNNIYSQSTLGDSGFDAGYTVETALESLSELYRKDIQNKYTSSRGEGGVYANFTRNILKNKEKSLTFDTAQKARAAIEEYIDKIDKSDKLVRKYRLIDFEEFDSVKQIVKEAVRVNQKEFMYVAPFLLPYLEDLSERISEVSAVAKRINIFIEAVNTLLGDISISYSSNSGFKLHNKSKPYYLDAEFSDIEVTDNIIEPGLLSSGEKHLILLLAKVAFVASQNRVLLMVDEPEISLGILWQKVLVKYIRDFSEGSDVQIVLATHSPIILEDYRKEDIIFSKEYGGVPNV